MGSAGGPQAQGPLEEGSQHGSSAVRLASDPIRVMRRVVDETMRLIGGAEGAVVEIADADTLTYVCCAGTLVSSAGLRLPILGSLSGLAVRTNSTLSCEDTETDPRVDREACRRTGIRSMVCVPLRQGDRAVGVLKVSAGEPGSFGEHAVATLGCLAEFISAIVSSAAELHRVASAVVSAGTQMSRSARPDQDGISQFVANVLVPDLVADLEARERIARVVAERAFSTVYQPIVDLGSGETVAVEALARFVGPPDRGPDVWFAEARAVGLGAAAELAALEVALSRLDDLPPPCRMAVNLGPEAIVADGLLGILGRFDLRQITIELTEHVEVADYPSLRAQLAELRRSGARFAIDDTGAGFASFSHIVKLAPDVIKLDLELTQGIDLDPVRRSLATAVVAFAADTGAEVVAEGVETPGELDALRALGVGCGQGYLLGRPAPLETLRLATVNV